MDERYHINEKRLKKNVLIQKIKFFIMLKIYVNVNKKIFIVILDILRMIKITVYLKILLIKIIFFKNLNSVKIITILVMVIFKTKKVIVKVEYNIR